jgi:leucyl-tRNA synthetase
LQSVIASHPEPFQRLIHQGISKSRGNVVNPDEIVDSNGADAPRMYEMFMGPLEAVKPWQTSQISGVTRFQNKVYNVIHNAIESQATEMDEETTRLLHKTMKRVTDDIESLNFNTAIYVMMLGPHRKRTTGGRRENRFDGFSLCSSSG